MSTQNMDENRIQDYLNMLKEVWHLLARISDEVLMAEGRVYGGGLHKLKPRELGNTLSEKIFEV